MNSIQEPPEPSEEEWLERNETQIIFLQSYLDWYRQRFNHEPQTNTELLVELINVGLAEHFALIYQMSRDELNRWVTGETVGHNPNVSECFWHFYNYLQGLEAKTMLESD